MIPLSVPNISGNEWKYVKDCFDTGWISSVGSYVNKFERMVADFVGSKYGIAAVNGTAALHISLLLAGVKQDDYVLLPNLTFVASANSIKYAGAEPLLIDADDQLWQMDLDLLDSFLNKETYIDRNELFLRKNNKRIGAIMPVHVLGNMFDMDRFMEIVRKYPLPVIEDATEALGSTFREKKAGTFGLVSAFSFNGNKIISTGGGGVIVTDDEQIAAKAKHLTTTAKANPDEYYHDDIGYNYRLVNVLAAIGVAQMENLEKFIERKKEITAFYKSCLHNIGDIQFQQELSSVNANNWLFTIRTEKQEHLLSHLNSCGIISRKFWVPMNRLPMYKDCIYITDSDVSGKLYESCLSIPCSTNITDEELATVCHEIKGSF